MQNFLWYKRVGWLRSACEVWQKICVTKLLGLAARIWWLKVKVHEATTTYSPISATLLLNWNEDGLVYKKRCHDVLRQSNGGQAGAVNLPVSSLNPYIRTLRLVFVLSFVVFDIGYAIYLVGITVFPRLNQLNPGFPSTSSTLSWDNRQTPATLGTPSGPLRAF